MIRLFSAACPFGHPAKQHLFGTEETFRSAHLHMRFPRLLVTFWAKWGNQPASVLGCPSTGRPTCPSRCFQADTTCNTALHTPAVFAGGSGAQGLSVSWAFSSCHRHPCLKPVSVQASPNSPWSTNWGVQGLNHSHFALCRNGNQTPLEQSAPATNPAQCGEWPFQLLLLMLLHFAKLNIDWGKEQKYSPASEEKEQCTTCNLSPAQPGLPYPLHTP